MIFQFYHLLPNSRRSRTCGPIMIRAGVWQYWNAAAGPHPNAPRSCSSWWACRTGSTICPRELSGGEMQRAASRAPWSPLPRLLLADEPTGNLDRRSGSRVLRILRTLNREEKLTIVNGDSRSGHCEQAACHGAIGRKGQVSL